LKKILLCIFTGTFLVACGGSSSTDDNTQTGPLDPSKIHDVVPSVNYDNAQGLIDDIDFDHQQNGEYTSSMFNTVF